MSRPDVLDLIRHDPWMMKALRTLRRADLPDCWIVAGFVRHKVWDHLHGKVRRTLPTDLDVVFFDPDRPPEQDRRIEEQLGAWAPEYPWEVYNQAHMHTYNGHAPYTSSVDSFSRWAETVSTIGVSLNADGSLELAAPHGIDDLVHMIIRPTPHADARRDVFEQRLPTKAWQALWPKVRVVR